MDIGTTLMEELNQPNNLKKLDSDAVKMIVNSDNTEMQNPPIDPNTIPTFVPSSAPVSLPSPTIIENKSAMSIVDTFYDDISMPVLLIVLYFLFQMPILRKFLLTHVPSLFLNDGNYNIFGLIATSVLFGTVYYVFTKVFR
jgi:hypothetical protein